MNVFERGNMLFLFSLVCLKFKYMKEDILNKILYIYKLVFICLFGWEYIFFGICYYEVFILY